MRFELDCELENTIIPSNYTSKILSYLKKSLEDYNPEIKKIFYDEPREKDMSFSCFLFIEKIENNKIFLKNKKFKITISVENVMEALHFYNAFFYSRNKKFLLGNENSFRVQRIRKIKEKEINEETAVFRTLSPVVIRERFEGNKNWYHLLNEEKGLEVLKKNLVFTLSKKFPKELVEELEIIPINIRKTVVHFYDLKFPASKGIFMVKGNKKILEHLYKAGFASRKSCGFGLLDIV